MITEDGYDMMSIQTLLGQKFDTIQFKHLLPRLKGSALGSEKTKRAIHAEFKTSDCAFIIFMMDLDGLASQADLVASKYSLFDSLNALCGGKLFQTAQKSFRISATPK